MIKKIDHLVITTASPQACLDFYENLGFQTMDAPGRYELYAGDFKINVHVKGHELMPNAANATPGSADLCFEITGSLEEFCDQIKAKGIHTELGIVRRTGVGGPMRSIYLRDPDGNLIEFSSYL